MQFYLLSINIIEVGMHFSAAACLKAIFCHYERSTQAKRLLRK